MCLEINRRKFVAALGSLTVSPLLTSAQRIAAASASSQAAGEDAWKNAGQINFGTDYYVEDWPVERLETDAQLMARAGFTTVRLLDTNWQRMEPAEGRYSFAWLDHVLEVLHGHGIRAILCTSSYAAPEWLVQKDPTIHLVDEQGHRYPSGGMGYFCLNHPVYRLHVAKLVTALALYYGHHPSVIGWQIDNEFGYWGERCYDTRYCVPAYRQSLKKKFGTLDELNRRLHTVSYGHEYTAWEQISLRIDIHGEGDALQVPLVLEAKRFFSRNMVQFMAFQAKILHTHIGANQFITHNGPSVSNNVFDFARNLDFLAEDLYPFIGQFDRSGFATDLMRGANHGKTFQVLEQRSGTLGSYTLNDATPPPGLVRLWAWQTIAHGSDGVLFFRWRRNAAGAEPYWQGLLDFDGNPALPFAEISRMGADLREHGSRLAQSGSPAKVAGIVSYDSYWAINIGHKEFPYFETLTSWTRAFRQLQMNVDLVEPTADLSSYKIVFAPALYIVDAVLAKRLEDFVAGGGTLILGPRAGFANEDDVSRQAPPGLLQPVSQVKVNNFTPLGNIKSAQAKNSESGVYQASANNVLRATGKDWPGPFQAGVWADILTLTGGKSLYDYGEDFYAGQPAVSIAESGKGRTIYVGTLPESSFYTAFAEQLCKLAGVNSGAPLPEAVDFTIRQQGDTTYRFLMNFAAETTTVAIAGVHMDLLSGKRFSGAVDIPPFDLRILAEDH